MAGGNEGGRITFPAIEKAKLARLLLFCYLTGNEDMHLMNFSLRSGLKAVSPSNARSAV
jgi:serine/threonine-protein kinase HipA